MTTPIIWAIDDDTTLLDLYRMVCAREFDAEVIIFQGATPALIAHLDALTPGEVPHVILLDTIMPEQDGPTLCRERIRPHPLLAEVPVILNGAQNYQYLVEVAEDSGVTEIFSKPIVPADLVMLLSKYL